MPDYGYIGVKPCGCAVAAIVDRPEYKADVAKALRNWIKHDLTIERVTVEAARERLKQCPHKPAPEPTLFDKGTDVKQAT